MAEQQKLTQQEEEAKFRSCLEDVMVVVENLADHCTTPDEMIGMLRLAMTNDAQMRMLRGKMKPR